MLALGYLDLYTVPVAIAVTLPLVILSYVPARATARDIYHAVITDRGLDGLDWLLRALAAIAIIMLLLIKGLYPSGGHDYFTHYFYYFQAVIERARLWPNDVWYHYYYDKGAGLLFLGILLTDPLAPQLVTFTFMATAGLVLFLLLRRITPDTLWPLAGTALFFFVYIYTPGAALLYSMNGGWGDFEKLHEINAALVIAILWMTFEALTNKGRKQILWSIAAASTVVCAVLVNTTIAIYLGGFFALLAFAAPFRTGSRPCWSASASARLPDFFLLRSSSSIRRRQGLPTIRAFYSSGISLTSISLPARARCRS